MSNIDNKGHSAVNAKWPREGFSGRVSLWAMNIKNSLVCKWTFSDEDISKCKHILDIGCGGGWGLDYLSKLAKHAIIQGIDQSPASIRNSKKFNNRKVRKKIVVLTEGNACSMPYENETFDLVTMTETLPFVDDVKTLFDEISRVTKQGGRLIICNEEQTPDGYENWAKLQGKTIYHDYEIKKFMQNVGFSDVVVSNHENGRWIYVKGIKRPF